MCSVGSSQAESHPANAPVPTQPQPNLLWPYYTRILAICMVVVIHAVGGSVIHTAFGSQMWWGSILLDSAASWAVPVFAMMSGALLLAPGRWSGAGAFYRRRLVKVGLPTVVWIGIYIAFRHWYLEQDFTVHDALSFSLAGFPFTHLYFLFVILGLYAITPLLRILVEHLTRRQFAGLAAACLFLSWFNYFIGATLGVPFRPNAITFFLPYIGYFLMGYVLRDVIVRGTTLWLIVVGIAATIVGEAVQALYLRSLAPLSKFGALTIAMSLLAFVVLVQVGRIAAERGYTGRIARPLADAALGVYLIHFIVLEVFTDSVGISLRPATVGNLVITLAVVIVVSWAIILVVRRVPVLNRIA